jgi:hypothetical protein
VRRFTTSTVNTNQKTKTMKDFITVQNALKAMIILSISKKLILMTILFQENDTANSIKAFEGLRNSFEKEIARKRNRLIEHTNCQEYFERAKDN